MKILGLHHGGHDTAASITINGKLIAACEEERYNKEKHTRDFPINAIRDCQESQNLKLMILILFLMEMIHFYRLERNI